MTHKWKVPDNLYILPPMFWSHELPHSNRSSQQFSKRSFCPSRPIQPISIQYTKTGAGISQSVLRLATGCTVRDSKPVAAEGFLISTPAQIRPSGHPASRIMGTGDFSGGWSSRDVALTTHPDLVPRLRMSGPIPPLPFCACMAWCEDTFTFTCMRAYIHNIQAHTICSFCSRPSLSHLITSAFLSQTFLTLHFV